MCHFHVALQRMLHAVQCLMSHVSGTSTKPLAPQHRHPLLRLCHFSWSDQALLLSGLDSDSMNFSSSALEYVGVISHSGWATCWSANGPLVMAFDKIGPLV